MPDLRAKKKKMLWFDADPNSVTAGSCTVNLETIKISQGRCMRPPTLTFSDVVQRHLKPDHTQREDTDALVELDERAVIEYLRM